MAYNGSYLSLDAAGRREADGLEPLDADAESRFAEGLVLDDRRGTRCAAATLERLGARRVRVTLAEGMHHQVIRMVGACGGTVVGLARTAVGPVELGALAPGTARPVTDAALVAIGVFGGTRFDGRVRLTAPHLEWWSGAAMRVGRGGRRAELLKVGYSNGALDLGVKRGARGIVLLLADDEAKLAPIARRAGFAVDGAGAFG